MNQLVHGSLGIENNFLETIKVDKTVSDTKIKRINSPFLFRFLLSGTAISELFCLEPTPELLASLQNSPKDFIP